MCRAYGSHATMIRFFQRVETRCYKIDRGYASLISLDVKDSICNVGFPFVNVRFFNVLKSVIIEFTCITTLIASALKTQFCNVGFPFVNACFFNVLKSIFKQLTVATPLISLYLKNPTLQQRASIR
jgi:hypothetical protein